MLQELENENLLDVEGKCDNLSYDYDDIDEFYLPSQNCDNENGRATTHNKWAVLRSRGHSRKTTLHYKVTSMKAYTPEKRCYCRIIISVSMLQNVSSPNLPRHNSALNQGLEVPYRSATSSCCLGVHEQHEYVWTTRAYLCFVPHNISVKLVDTLSDFFVNL